MRLHAVRRLQRSPLRAAQRTTRRAGHMDSIAPAPGSLPQNAGFAPPLRCGIENAGSHTLRGRRDLDAYALAGLGVIVFLVVLVITAQPGGHTATALELAIEILVWPALSCWRQAACAREADYSNGVVHLTHSSTWS